jgi:hypothetical protein
LEEIMLGKTTAVLALAASCLALSVPPSLAGSKSRPAAFAGLGWYDTDASAAHSRANPAEKVLTASAVKNVKYLRSVVAPPTLPRNICGTQTVVAPLPYGGSLYAITDGTLSKYNPATGELIWRRIPSQVNTYNTLAISGNLVIMGGSNCESASEPAGVVYAYNATTGALIFGPDYGAQQDDMVKVGPYVVTAGDDAAGYAFSVLNVSNGKQVWTKYECDSAGVNPPALVVGLQVMTYGCDGQGNETIEAHNLATGALTWSLSGNWVLQRGDLSGSTGQYLYVTDPSGTVEALNPHTAQVQYSLNGATNVLAVDTSRVYAACGGTRVCAYNLSTGALEWRSGFLNTNTPPTLAAEADGVLYVDEGSALNAMTGKVISTLWGSPGEVNPTATALAVGDGRIAVVTDPRVIDLYGQPGY